MTRLNQGLILTVSLIVGMALAAITPPEKLDGAIPVAIAIGLTSVAMLAVYSLATQRRGWAQNAATADRVSKQWAEQAKQAEISGRQQRWLQGPDNTSIWIPISKKRPLMTHFRRVDCLQCGQLRRVNRDELCADCMTMNNIKRRYRS